MAEEAFALSPISARPTVPGEADYDAIREAFMETSRGRWFLNEYAKRNRHTDTGMVLEAVARIEASLAAQKQPPAISLIESLGAIRSAVRQAKATAIEAMPRAESDETLTAARNGARIIREIAWTLRECGADIRICDLLDTQVKAIDAGQQSSAGDGREEVLASYDLLMQRIEQLVDGSAAAPASHAKTETPPAAAAEKPTQSAADTREASVTPLFKSQASEVLAETVTISQPAAPRATAQPATTETVAEVAAPIADSSAEFAATMAEASAPMAMDEVAIAPETALDAETEHDLAVLDMVATEMGAPDLSEPDVAASEMLLPEAFETQAAEPEAIHPDLMTLAQIAEVALAPEPPQPEVALQAPAPSLGAALIANGVISNPNAPASDPLAPIRRMSQAEKIAFFS
ncbi:MAG: hypothetical protein JWP84_3500 [Tardiphaga sp.]|nr:hypothetical protein [Tardiphaga sp.]